MADWPYNSAQWQRLRSAKLARDPLCEDCEKLDRIVVAKCVDHRKAISQGGDPFPPLDELASLCWPCHSRKTARGAEAGSAKSDRPTKGCDKAGNPLDRTHPWA